MFGDNRAVRFYAYDFGCTLFLLFYFIGGTDMYCTNCGTKFEGKFCPCCGEEAQSFIKRNPSLNNSDRIINQAESNNSEINNTFPSSKYYPEHNDKSTNENSNTENKLGSVAIIKKQPWFSAKIVIGIISMIISAFEIIYMFSINIISLQSTITLYALISCVIMLLAGIISVAMNNSYAISGSICSSVLYLLAFILSTQTTILFISVQIMGGLALSFCVVHLGSLLARMPAFVFNKVKKAILIICSILLAVTVFFITPAMFSIYKGIDISSNILSNINFQVQTNDGKTVTGNNENVTISFKEMLDEYESFMDEYCDFMKKYKNSDNMKGMMKEYSEYLERYNEFVKKVDQVDEKSLSKSDLDYYIEVTTRVSKKLMELSQ